jgi:HlyD family secretion protein
VRRLILLIVLAAACAGLVWALVIYRNQPPEVQFVRVTREAVQNSVPTNGKVEPIEWAAARAGRSGPVAKILVQRGQRVARDAPLVEFDSADASADLAAAQARIAQIRGDLEVMERGGRATDLAEISSNLDRGRLELETAEREYAALQRLQSKQAATGVEVATAKERVDRAQLQIRSFEQRRSALVATTDRTSAEARLKEAEAAAALAEQRVRQSVVRAPIEGVLYQFDLKPGAYLNAGDTVGAIGRLDRVKVNVYVDEPDLGRVAKGMPVTITWDALPGREWMGEVDKTATEVVALGTRQVGEVACVIQNPDRDLLPGTNVNIQIQAQSVADALAIPKEAVRTQNGKTGVFVLAGDHLAWKNITLGIANTTRTQVEGLNEGEDVALPSEKPLRDGMPVKAAIQ